MNKEFVKFGNLFQLFFGTFGKVWAKISQISEMGLDATTFGAQFFRVCKLKHLSEFKENIRLLETQGESFSKECK